MPLNMSASRVTITVRVVRAFFHSGGWKAGTPSEIASTPVSAVQPEANALSSRKMLTCRVACREMSGPPPDGDHREHHEDAGDEEVGRRREDAPRLADAAQVADDEED